MLMSIIMGNVIALFKYHMGYSVRGISEKPYTI